MLEGKYSSRQRVINDIEIDTNQRISVVNITCMMDATQIMFLFLLQVMNIWNCRCLIITSWEMNIWWIISIVEEVLQRLNISSFSLVLKTFVNGAIDGYQISGEWCCNTLHAMVLGYVIENTFHQHLKLTLQAHDSHWLLIVIFKKCNKFESNNRKIPSQFFAAYIIKNKYLKCE